MTSNKSFYFIGFGSIGQALLPALIAKGVPPSKINLLAADLDGLEIAKEFGLEIKLNPLYKENFKETLSSVFDIKKGDVVVNLSVNVSSIDLLTYCQEKEWLYIDTSFEDWDDYSDKSNQEFRDKLHNLNPNKSTTAVVCHGANPGLISHLAVEGLRSLAKLKNISDFDSYGELAYKLGIKVIQIAENDTQISDEILDSNTFYNTWSVDGLVAELLQKAEIGVGAHESLSQKNTLDSIGANTLIKSWTPSAQDSIAYLIAHPEAASISEYLTFNNYKPTVYYAYNPSPHTKKSIDKWKDSGYTPPISKKVLKKELTSGTDDLGVLFVYEGGAYWYGSALNLADARGIAGFDHNGATSLQVVAGLLGALEWMLLNQNAGIVEPEQLDSDLVLLIARPYLGNVYGIESLWKPCPSGDLYIDNFLIK